MNRRALILSGAACFIAAPASAHRSKRSETVIRIGDEGALEITHVFHIQDAQDALFAAGIIDKPDIGSLKARAQLSLYTADRFGIQTGDQWARLNILDAEVRGSSIYVYQTGQLGHGALSVKADMLRDLIPGHRISVNVVENNITRTLEFSGDDGVKSLSRDSL